MLDFLSLNCLASIAVDVLLLAAPFQNDHIPSSSDNQSLAVNYKALINIRKLRKQFAALKDVNVLPDQKYTKYNHQPQFIHISYSCVQFLAI